MNYYKSHSVKNCAQDNLVSIIVVCISDMCHMYVICVQFFR